MPADITSANLVHRFSLLVEPEALVVLDHESSKDRVRRLLFDRVESVLVWRRTAWLQIALVGGLLGVPGVLILLIGETPALVIGGILLGLAALLEARYLYFGRTTVRVARAGKPQDFDLIASPGRVQRFVDRLTLAIADAQSRGEREALLRESAPAADPADAETPSPPPGEEPRV